jgi:hypothetical protein
LTRELTPRRHRRRRVKVAASCRTGNGRAREAELTDLSEAGCQLRIASGSVSPDQRVLVRPGALEGVTGIVRWSEGEAAGVAFDGEVHPAVVDHMAGEGEVLGCPPARRAENPEFTDRFGRSLPTLGTPRRTL